MPLPCPTTVQCHTVPCQEFAAISPRSQCSAIFDLWAGSMPTRSTTAPICDLVGRIPILVGRVGGGDSVARVRNVRDGDAAELSTDTCHVAV